MNLFRKHLFSFVMVPLCVLALGASYYRFVVVEHYIVAYEGDCDPATEECFVGYDDAEELYYYTKIEKSAPDLKAECGPDITDCEDAQVCLLSDTVCSITYCSPEALLEDEECEDVSGENQL